jgi:hypothetical protein
MNQMPVSTCSSFIRITKLIGSSPGSPLI